MDREISVIFLRSPPTHKTSVKVKERTIGVTGPLSRSAQVDQRKKFPRNAKQPHIIVLILVLLSLIPSQSFGHTLSDLYQAIRWELSRPLF